MFFLLKQLTKYMRHFRRRHGR